MIIHTYSRPEYSTILQTSIKVFLIYMSCWNKSGSVKNLVQFCRGYQFINKKISSMFEFTVKRTHNMYNK